jgi:7-cyano-7-deazaguanine synthase
METAAKDNELRSKALVLFSGGQDSAICLAWALQRFAHVETVGFAYGQVHEVEMSARQEVLGLYRKFRPQWAERLGPDHIVDLAGLGAISETALTRVKEISIDADGLPTTFVPGRNLAFLVYAGALCFSRDISTLVAGMCQTDFSGYPDCRQDTLDAQMRALSLGLDRDLSLVTPLMHLTKGQSWTLAEQLGGQALVALINQHSHSCYRGGRETHDWGHGCGNCPACDLREKGWQDYLGGAPLPETFTP